MSNLKCNLKFVHEEYINLENPQTRSFLREDPKSVLRNGKERLIIDEAQREPEVFSDSEKIPGQFILTGSNQPELGEAVSQSLAGRSASALRPSPAGSPSWKPPFLFLSFIPIMQTWVSVW